MPPPSSFHTEGFLIDLVAAASEPKARIVLHLGEVVKEAEEDGGIYRLLFCVLFWVQTRRTCF